MPDLPPRTFALPEGVDVQSPGNAASNGHWIHDDYGPRDYVAPAPAETGTRPAADLIAAARAALSARATLDIDRIHLTVEGSTLTLAGFVASAAERYRAVAAVGAALRGVTVRDRLAVDEALSGGPDVQPKP